MGRNRGNQIAQRRRSVTTRRGMDRDQRPPGGTPVLIRWSVSINC
jgi:hypothetical protein